MSRRSPALVLVHIVWATRRRRALLPPAFDATLIAMLGDNARRLDSSLLAAGCAADHVHVVVRVSPTAALSNLVRQLKGASSRDISERALLPSLSWQDGYWAESLGPDDFDPLAAYVRAQRIHHDDSHPAERWQFHADLEPAPAGLSAAYNREFAAPGFSPGCPAAGGGDFSTPLQTGGSFAITDCMQASTAGYAS